MDFDIRRLKGTPVKLVYYGDEVAGCFYYGNTYVRKENFDDTILNYINQWHANSLTERLEMEDGRLGDPA